MTEILDNGLEIEKTLVVSTIHIMEADDAFFTQLQIEPFKLTPPLIIDDLTYGWYIYIPSDENDFNETCKSIQEDTSLSDIFLDLFKLTRELDCRYLKLDRDGPIAPDLPQGDW